MKTWAGTDAIVDVVQQKQAPPHDSFVRHPVRAAENEVAHLREIADEGESPVTFPIVIGAVLMFVVPVAVTLVFLALAIAHFA